MRKEKFKWAFEDVLKDGLVFLPKVVLMSNDLLGKKEYGERSFRQELTF
jgi:hypothetical protein